MAPETLSPCGTERQCICSFGKSHWRTYGKRQLVSVSPAVSPLQWSLFPHLNSFLWNGLETLPLQSSHLKNSWVGLQLAAHYPFSIQGRCKFKNPGRGRKRAFPSASAGCWALVMVLRLSYHHSIQCIIVVVFGGRVHVFPLGFVEKLIKRCK